MGVTSFVAIQGVRISGSQIYITPMTSTSAVKIMHPSIFDELPIQTNMKGVQWRKLQYVLEMQVSSGQLNWTVKHQGIERGKITSGVEYESVRAPKHERQEFRG
jgi:hypothetical protein